jgi:hypothetical protein
LRQRQIPFRNDRKKIKGNYNGNSRFPAGMTTRKAKADSELCARYSGESALVVNLGLESGWYV